MDFRMIDVTYIKQHRKIAVIDTGLNATYPDFAQKDIEFVPWGGQNFKKDQNGHGTGMVAGILRYHPDAELMILPVLNKEKTCNLYDLYRALSFCLEHEEIGMINLSLSCRIRDMDVVLEFHKLFRQIRAQGKLVLAAEINGNRKGKTYPFSFPEVIGVAKARVKQENIIQYQKQNNICFITADEKLCYATPDRQGRYVFRIGTSSQTAQLTGLLSYTILHSAKNKISMTEAIRECNAELKQFQRMEQKTYARVTPWIAQTVKQYAKEWLVDRAESEGRKRTLTDLSLDECALYLNDVYKKFGHSFEQSKISLYDISKPKCLAAKCGYFENIKRGEK